MRNLEKTEAKLSKFAKGKKLIHDNLWYGVIGILSFAVLVFFPMIGSGLPLTLNLPTTAIGWVVDIFSKLAVAAINICIFHSFMEQGKLNVSGYWKKLLADEILQRVKRAKESIPLSPEQWLAKEYKSKGISIAVTSILSCIVLSQVVLSFDVIVFISFLLTLVIGLVFGVMQLFKSEAFWSQDYYTYALYMLEQFNLERPEDQKLIVKDKKLYEGAELIYEYIGI